MISVAYVDHMGDDLRVANALRKSFDAEHAAWSETPRGPRQRSDRALVEDCARDGDDAPWRHCQVTLACAAAVPIARQLSKHQVGLTWSEVSRRYKTRNLDFHRLRGTWRAAPADRRQGSGAVLNGATQRELGAIEDFVIAVGLDAYGNALLLGASPEQARFLLPQSLVVAWTWTGSLLAFAHLCKKRGAGTNAQGETRAFAGEVAAIVAPLFPVSWAALMGKAADGVG